LDNDKGRQRDPRVVALFACATIVAGLASRRFPESFPDWFARYGGDALWAALVFWVVALCWRRGLTIHVAAAALAIACAVEVSQLYHAPWLDAIRATRIGALLLGSGFLWSDLVCYCAGTALAAGVDTLIRRRSGS
jgi:hypothetical protein